MDPGETQIDTHEFYVRILEGIQAFAVGGGGGEGCNCQIARL